MRQAKGDAEKRGEALIEGDSPDEALAAEVVAALVADDLISAADGESVEALLAGGQVDASKWRFIFENHIQRKAGRNERE